MKIVRYFITAESDETGLRGFLPLWVPGGSNFDPGGLRLMVHDMLEHRLCDQGHFHEELMAFGRVIALRGVTYLSDRFGQDVRVDRLGTELGAVWVDGVEAGDLRIPHAPPTRALVESWDAEQWVQGIAKKACETAYREAESRSDTDDFTRPTSRLHAALVGWMRIGYRDALRRYGEQDHGCYDVGHAAFGWASENDRRFEQVAEEAIDYGREVVARLCFDTDTLRMDETLIEPNWQTGMFPEWLATRIRRWKGSRPLPIVEPHFYEA